MSENNHSGHRARLKSRLKSEGAAKLDDTTVLELLLTYALPRRDTRPIAEALIQRYRTLKNVINAPMDDLVLTDGISEHTALLIGLMPEIAERLKVQSSDADNLFVSDMAGNYFVSKYRGVTDECVMAMALTDGGEVVDCTVVKHGDINSASFQIRSLTEVAIKNSVSHLMIAHNHPSGNLIPSAADLDTTRRISLSLASNGIELCEHFICSDKGYIKLMH